MLTAAIVVFLVSAPQAAALETQVRALIAGSGAEVAVAFRTLDGSTELLVDPDKPFHAASTMKIPVMIELFRQAGAGTLTLDETLPIRNAFRSIVDGSPYTLNVGDDSDREVYANVGKTMTLRALNEAMITVSSNFATNLLIERLGVQNVRNTVTRLGADGMQVFRGVEDTKAFEKGLNNSTTARGLLVLLETLGRGAAAGRAADGAMVDVLARQKFADAIPAGLPRGTRVAHKTGTITRIHHDAAIVYGAKPYVLVVLVRGIQDQKVSGPLIASISKAVWDAMN
jgi:beta-lactamase class A